MLILLLSILTLAGFASLLYAMNRADVGYEDDSGYHVGLAPKRATAAMAKEMPAAKIPVAAVTPALPPTEKVKPSKRSPRRIERKVLPADSLAAFQLELDACFPQVSGQKVGSVEKR